MRTESQQPPVTIVVVPREQFAKALMSLESIRASTPPEYPLVYVDGNSPPDVAGYLRREAEQGRLTLIRREYYLGGNEARNLGLRHVHTKYAVFIDNDVVVSPGWIEALLTCAEETGASVVGPLYCINEPEGQKVHTAGADLSIEEHEGRRRLLEKHHQGGRSVDEARRSVGRSSCDEVEFHCLLARTSVFQEIGELDEGLVSYFDHTDFCLSVRKVGGTIFSETAALVTYFPPAPVTVTDVPYFLLRWSSTWYSVSLDRFCAKWDLDPDDRVFASHVWYRLKHRWRLPTPWVRVNHGIDLILGPALERTLVVRLERRRSSENPANIPVRAAS